MFIFLSGKGTCAKYLCTNQKCPNVGHLKGGKCNKEFCDYDNGWTNGGKKM